LRGEGAFNIKTLAKGGISAANGGKKKMRGKDRCRPEESSSNVSPYLPLQARSLPNRPDGILQVLFDDV